MARLKRLGSEGVLPPAENARGFTLVEVIAAAAILMLGLAVIARTFVGAINQKSVLSQRLSAQRLASSKMEEAFAGAPGGEGVSGTGEDIFWRRTLGPSEIPGMLEAEVVVTWSVRGRENDFTLTSLVPYEKK